jgi:heme exporter protein A
MLSVNKVSFGFPHRPILRDFSLTVQKGELVHISGPNGAGKSTLMSLIAGLIPVDRGSITYTSESGQEVDDRRWWIEYVPAEANGLFPKMNALQNLSFWAKLRGHNPSPKDLEKSLVAELKFWGLSHSLLLGPFPVEKYSTGMKRRLALARLTLSQTPCWLLDEPVYGLDAGATESFRNVLDQHLKRGGLAVMISHDLAALKDLSYRKMVLNSDQGEAHP